MSYDIRTVCFDFLDSFWNVTTAHLPSHFTCIVRWIISGDIKQIRYQAVSIEAVPVASLIELDIQRSELQGVQGQEWGIPNHRNTLGSSSVASCLDQSNSVGSQLHLQTLMRHWLNSKTTQSSSNSRKFFLHLVVLNPHFVFLNANWKSSLSFLLCLCCFIVLISQHCIF